MNFGFNNLAKAALADRFHFSLLSKIQNQNLPSAPVSTILTEPKGSLQDNVILEYRSFPKEEQENDSGASLKEGTNQTTFKLINRQQRPGPPIK